MLLDAAWPHERADVVPVRIVQRHHRPIPTEADDWSAARVLDRLVPSSHLVTGDRQAVVLDRQTDAFRDHGPVRDAAVVVHVAPRHPTISNKNGQLNPPLGAPRLGRVGAAFMAKTRPNRRWFLSTAADNSPLSFPAS